MFARVIVRSRKGPARKHLPLSRFSSPAVANTIPPPFCTKHTWGPSLPRSRHPQVKSQGWLPPDATIARLWVFACSYELGHRLRAARMIRLRSPICSNAAREKPSALAIPQTVTMPQDDTARFIPPLHTTAGGEAASTIFGIGQPGKVADALSGYASCRSLPGVNVFRAPRLVTVRKVDPGLNFTSVKGARLLALENDAASVALEVVASGVIESVEVKKLLTANLTSRHDRCCQRQRPEKIPSTSTLNFNAIPVNTSPKSRLPPRLSRSIISRSCVTWPANSWWINHAPA